MSTPHTAPASLDDDSGAIPLVDSESGKPPPTRSRRCQEYHDHGGLRWQPLAVAAACFAVLALILWVTYRHTAAESHAADRTLLAVSIAGFGTLCGAALLMWLTQWVADRRRAAMRCCLARDIAERDQRFLGRLGAVEALLGQTLAELERRVGAVERAVAEQDEEYERGWVAGAAKTAEALPQNGQVRALRPTVPPPEPRRPVG